MLTHRSTNAANSKMLVFIPLLMVCILCFSKNSYSQKPKKTYTHILAFGQADKGNHKITYDQALANLRITCKEKGCEVTGFAISFLPDVKGGEISGPYTIKGANVIQGMALQKLKAFKESKEPEIRIFLDDIKVNRNGKEEPAPGQIFFCSLK